MEKYRCFEMERKKNMAKKSAQVPLYEQVLKELKGKIVSGVYRKGDLLPSEKELIEEFGVSRITVRKTLSLLAEMGFIETSKGRGSEVLFSPDHVASHYGFAEAVEEYYDSFMTATQIRRLLEPEVVKELTANITKEQVEYLRSCMSGDAEKDELEDFHRTLIGLLGNQKLNEMMEQLMVLEEAKVPLGILQPESQKKMRDVLEEQHLKIFGAIEEGNAEFAYFYMKEHMAYIIRSYQKYFEMLRK